MKTLILLTLILLVTLALNAQVAINTDATTADPSAMLDVKSDTAGILIPRTDTTSVNNAGIPATGLIIYQSADNNFYYYNGVKWVVIAAGSNPVFERNGTTIRQVSHYDTDDFIIGRDFLPKNGEDITYDKIFFFDKSKAALRAGFLFNSENWSPDSIGSASFCFGGNTKAKGDYSAAWGANSEAIGESSTAWGETSQATGVLSTAWGGYTQATGEASTAWGIHTIAKSFGETALGQYNTSYTPLNATYWNSNDRLFQIGNGTSSSARSNALTIYKNGATIIGSDNMPANGVATTDKLLFFNKATGSFRGGSLYSSVNWSPDSIGTASFAYPTLQPKLEKLKKIG